MKNRALFSILVLMLSFAATAPVFAGTVYVPWTTSWTSNGVELTTTVRVTNRSDSSNAYTMFYLPADADGAIATGDPIVQTLGPHATHVFEGLDLESIAPIGEWGLLEIVGEGDLHVVTHLTGRAGQGVRLGTDLTPASSENLTAAGQTSVLQGLRRTTGKILTDLMIVNLSMEPAFCDIEVRRKGGADDGRSSLNLEPLSLRLENDVLNEIGSGSGTERSVFTTCDRDTFVFAVRRDLRNGEILVTHAGSDESTLVAPSRDGSPPPPPPPPPPPSATCGGGAVFEAMGDFHTARPGNAKKKFKILPPNQRFTRLVLEMEFTHGGWNNQDPDGNHAIFWLHRDKENRWAGNVFGYLNAFGPNKNFIRLGTNITHNISPQISKNGRLTPGRTYQVRYVYDTSTRVIRATIHHNGEEIVRITDNRTPNIIDSEGLGMFLIFGHPAVNNSGGPEVPTFGWTYSNLCVWTR